MDDLSELCEAVTGDSLPGDVVHLNNPHDLMFIRCRCAVDATDYKVLTGSRNPVIIIARFDMSEHFPELGSDRIFAALHRKYGLVWVHVRIHVASS